MIKFDKEELYKIAKLSSLKIDESEINSVIQQLKTTLEYAKQIDQAQLKTEKTKSIKNKNIFRKDIAIKKNSADILLIAPKVKDNYFVVPKMLKEKKSKGSSI